MLRERYTQKENQGDITHLFDFLLSCICKHTQKQAKNKNLFLKITVVCRKYFKSNLCLLKWSAKTMFPAPVFFDRKE